MAKGITQKEFSKRYSASKGEDMINESVSPAAKADKSYKGADRRQKEREKSQLVVKQLKEIWTPK